MSNTLNILARLAKPTSQMAGNVASSVASGIATDSGTMSPTSMGSSLIGLLSILSSMDAPEMQNTNVKQPTMRLPALGVAPMAGQVASSGDPNAFNIAEIEANKKAATKALNDEAKKNVEALGPQKVLEESINAEQMIQTSAGEGVRTQDGRMVKRTPVESQEQSQPTTQQPDAITKFGQTLAHVLTLGGALQSPAIASIRAQGEETRKTQKEKGEIDAFANLLKTGNKALSGDASKLVSNVQTGVQEIDALQKAFEKEPGLFKQIATPNNASAQMVKTYMEDLTDILGRLRSGGAINDDEYKRFTNQIPKFGFIKGRLEAPQTVKAKLEKLKTLFQDVSSLAQPNTQLSQGIQSALNAGYTKDQIMKRLKEKGVI